MNCPRCNHEIPDAFYCTSCGYVPAYSPTERNDFNLRRIHSIEEGSDRQKSPTNVPEVAETKKGSD